MIEKFSVCTLTIIMLTTWFLFILNVYFSIPLNTLSSTLTLIATTILVYLVIWKNFQKKSTTKNSKLFGSEKIILPLLLGIILINVVLNLYWLPLEGDSLTMYDFRGKVYSQSHNIQTLQGKYYGSYPLFTSIVHATLYLWNFENPKIFYSALLILFLMFFYSKMEQKIGRKGALYACLIVSSTPSIFMHSRIAYTNFTYLVYMVISLIYLINYLEEKRLQDLIFFSAFMAFTSWIRPATHPFFLANLLLILIFSIKNQLSLLKLSIPILFYCLFFTPWYIYQYYILKLQTYESVNFMRFLQQGVPVIGSIIPLLKHVLTSMLDIKYAGGIGIAFLTTILIQLFAKKELGKTKITFLVITVNFIAWSILSLLIRTEFTEYNLWLGILSDSMNRLFILFFPLFIYAMLQLSIFSKFWKAKNKHHR